MVFCIQICSTVFTNTNVCSYVHISQHLCFHIKKEEVEVEEEKQNTPEKNDFYTLLMHGCVFL